MLDDVRRELKKLPVYDPEGPVHKALLLRIVNDLAIVMGVDAAHVMELFESMAVDIDTADAMPERSLKALFDVLEPYHSGKVRELDDPVCYLSFTIDRSRVGRKGVLARDQIVEFAIKECGWPIGSTAAIGSGQFEMNYNLKDRRAYVLHSGGAYHVPMYNAALFRHMEKRDRMVNGEDENKDDDEDLFGSIRYGLAPSSFGKTVIGRPFGLSASAAAAAAAPLARGGVRVPKPLATTVVNPRYGKRVTMTVVDDPITEAAHAVGAGTNDMADAVAYAVKALAQTACQVREALIGIDFAYAKQKKTPSRPLAAPVRPAGRAKAPVVPGRLRSPERRCRAPPGDAV